MSEVVTIPGQSVLNVQIQGAGTLDSLFDTLRANSLDFEDPSQGTAIQVSAERPSLELAMKQSGIKPASSDTANDHGWDALIAINKAGGELLSLTCLLNTLKN